MTRHRSILCSVLLFCTLARAQSFMPPEPYGGSNSMKWFFDQDLVMSEADLLAGVEGNVALGFVVAADGSISNTRILHGINTACDAEALRLLRLIRWHPASVGGTSMNTEHQLDIPFSAKRWRKVHGKEAREPQPFLSIPANEGAAIRASKDVDTLATPLIDRGLRGLGTYLSANLKYPQEAFRRDIQGKVGLEFVVEADGAVSNLRATDALGGGCDDEAMRLIRTIRWRPAFKNGERVRSEVNLDIQFRLDPNQR